MTSKIYAFLDKDNYVVNTAIFKETETIETIQSICEANGGIKYQSFDEHGACSKGDLWLGYAYQPPCPGEGYVWAEKENSWYWKAPE